MNEPISDTEIANRFTYHQPIGNQSRRYEVLRNSARALAVLIRDLCPDSRERSTALTNIQQAIMWANAAIAINENESTSTVQIVQVPYSQTVNVLHIDVGDMNAVKQMAAMEAIGKILKELRS